MRLASSVAELNPCLGSESVAASAGSKTSGVSSAVERLLYTQRVGSSNLSRRTPLNGAARFVTPNVAPGDRKSVFSCLSRKPILPRQMGFCPILSSPGKRPRTKCKRIFKTTVPWRRAPRSTLCAIAAQVTTVFWTSRVTESIARQGDGHFARTARSHSSAMSWWPE